MTTVHRIKAIDVLKAIRRYGPVDAETLCLRMRVGRAGIMPVQARVLACLAKLRSRRLARLDWVYNPYEVVITPRGRALLVARRAKAESKTEAPSR